MIIKDSKLCKYKMLHLETKGENRKLKEMQNVVLRETFTNKLCFFMEILEYLNL